MCAFCYWIFNNGRNRWVYLTQIYCTCFAVVFALVTTPVTGTRRASYLAQVVRTTRMLKVQQNCMLTPTNSWVCVSMSVWTQQGPAGGTSSLAVSYLTTSRYRIVDREHPVRMVVSIVDGHNENAEREQAWRSDQYWQTKPDVAPCTEIP